jgi:hypothetical protein
MQQSTSKQLYAYWDRVRNGRIAPRRFEIVPVRVFGRFMSENKQEYPCQVINMSAGGMAMLCAGRLRYRRANRGLSRHPGRIEGIVVRSFEAASPCAS